MHSDARAHVGDLDLHYLTWGDPRAEQSIVMVHGLGSTAHIWDLCAPEVARATGARIVALDQRGHGLSDQPTTGYDFGSMVSDLTAFLDVVGVRGKAICVGHSWGASVVLHLAAEHPEHVAGVVLVDGGLSSPGERWSWAETEQRLRPPDLDGMRWDDLHARMSGGNPAYHDPRNEAMGRSMFRIDADGRVARRFKIPHHMQVVRALWEQRPADLFARIHCPVLILPARRPTDDPAVIALKVAAVERALSTGSHVQVQWFDDTVHDIPLHRPAELTDALTAFARKVLSTRATS